MKIIDIQIVGNSKSELVQISEDIFYLYIIIPKHFQKIFGVINPCVRIKLQEVKK